MNRNPSRRSSLFLLELMIAILFFCLCSAVCVRLFVQSHSISTDTQNLNMAMNETTNLAELFRGEEDYISAMAAAYPKGVADSDANTFSIYYDSDWAICAKEEAQYMVRAKIDARSASTEEKDNQVNTSTLLDGNFTATSLDDAGVIYEITTSKYVADSNTATDTSVDSTSANDASKGGEQ